MVAAVAIGIVLLSGGAGAAVAAPVRGGDDLYVRRTPPVVPADPGDPGRPVVAAEDDTRVLGRVVTRGQPMPITGGDVAGLAAIGLGSVALGSVLLRRGRRRPA